MQMLGTGVEIVVLTVLLTALMPKVELELVKVNLLNDYLPSTTNFMNFYKVRKVYQCAELCYYRHDCVSFKLIQNFDCGLSKETWSEVGMRLTEYRKGVYVYGEKKDIPASLIKNGCANHKCGSGTVCVSQNENEYKCIPEIPCADEKSLWCRGVLMLYNDGICLHPNKSGSLPRYAEKYKCNKWCKWCN